MRRGKMTDQFEERKADKKPDGNVPREMQDAWSREEIFNYKQNSKTPIADKTSDSKRCLPEITIEGHGIVVAPDKTPAELGKITREELQDRLNAMKEKYDGRLQKGEIGPPLKKPSEKRVVPLKPGEKNVDDEAILKPATRDPVNVMVRPSPGRPPSHFLKPSKPECEPETSGRNPPDRPRPGYPSEIIQKLLGNAAKG
jgi:phage pi2 protein 07